MFTGSIVAIVTPMQTDGSLDKRSLSNLIEWHIESKTDAFVVVGTTGESPTLTDKEQFEMISIVVDQVGKRVPVIAGTGSQATRHAIELTHHAKKAGADAALIITPYYNKPTQNGLYEHYKTIADQVALPIILYNVPGRTACDILPETIERLAKIPSIIGIKEATGNIARAIEIMQRCNKDFEVFSGDDITAYDLMLNGAKGVISVTANVAPHLMSNFCQSALSLNKALADPLNAKLMPLHKAMFLETSPIPVKWALQEMGLISAGIRLPLLTLDAKYHHELSTILQNIGILHEKSYSENLAE